MPRAWRLRETCGHYWASAPKNLNRGPLTSLATAPLPEAGVKRCPSPLYSSAASTALLGRLSHRGYLDGPITASRVEPLRGTHKDIWHPKPISHGNLDTYYAAVDRNALLPYLEEQRAEKAPFGIRRLHHSQEHLQPCLPTLKQQVFTNSSFPLFTPHFLHVTNLLSSRDGRRMKI